MAGTQPTLAADAALRDYRPPDQSAVAAKKPPMTLHNYGQTLFWTFAAVAACALFYAIEKYLVIGQLGWLPNDSLHRMFKNPAELPMRLFGLPHFVVGLLFMLSSKRMRGAKSIGQLIGLFAIGAGFCYLFGAYGQVWVEKHSEWQPSALALMLFYFYFLIHGFRDEAFFYKAYGDMPRDQAGTHERLMLVFQALMLGILLSILVPGYILYGASHPEYRHPLLESLFPAEWPYFVRFLSMIVPMALVAWFAVWRIARAYPDGLRGLWRAHYPILTVFFISTGIILLPLATGPWTFNIVVLMHFVAWYLFGRYSLRKHPPKEPPRTTWKWMRTTASGFTVLHLGLAAIVVVLVAISTYAFGKTGVLEEVVGSKTFYYWTIMHVTLSFFPRG